LVVSVKVACCALPPTILPGETVKVGVKGTTVREAWPDPLAAVLLTVAVMV
jgi:hypothetical protein